MKKQAGFLTQWFSRLAVVGDLRGVDAKQAHTPTISQNQRITVKYGGDKTGTVVGDGCEFS